MPTHTGKDGKGCFAQWGHQAKYHYKCGDAAARRRAIAKADKQGAAIRASGYTGNKGEVLMDKTFQYLTTNVKPTVRNDTMENRDWLVAPMIMMVEGVHNGSDGPIFYPAEELEKGIPITANHKPVVVYHPGSNGQGISACDPAEITVRKIGVIMHAAWEDAKAKGEAWMEPARIEAVDKRVGESLAKNEMMEVSLGLYMDLERIEGQWEGESYIGIARNLRVDHLAILPDLVGACSIEDGAGLLRTNAANQFCVRKQEGGIHVSTEIPDGDEEKQMVWINSASGIKTFGKMGDVPDTYVFDSNCWTVNDAVEWVTRNKKASIATLVMNEMSHEQQRRLLSGLVQAQAGDDVWIEEVYDDHLIYEKDGRLYDQAYSSVKGNLKLTGVAVEVVKSVSYKPVVMSKRTELKGFAMDKKKIIDGMIANVELPYGEADRDGLMALSEETLKALSEAQPATEQPPAADQPPAEEPKDRSAASVLLSDAATSKEIKPMTAEQYIAAAPTGIREVLQEGVATHATLRDQMVKKILANANNSFQESYLRERSLAELRGLVALMGEKSEPSVAPLFSGQAPVVDNISASPEDSEPLPLPSFADLVGAEKK